MLLASLIRWLGSTRRATIRERQGLWRAGVGKGESLCHVPASILAIRRYVRVFLPICMGANRSPRSAGSQTLTHFVLHFILFSTLMLCRIQDVCRKLE